MPTKKILKKKHTHYHKDGTIWAKGFMAGNKMEGKWVWFRKPARNAKAGGVGTKMRSGSFKNGIQTGKWTTYDKTGKVVKVTEMK